MDQPKTALEPGGSALQRLLTGSSGMVLLIALTILCYNRTVQFNWIWDDDAYVVNNPSLNDMNGLSRIWTHLGATPQYYPVTFTSFWIERQIVGPPTKLSDETTEDTAAKVSHIVNLSLHGASALLLWLVLRKLAVPGAWLAAAIFAVHPVNVESVAWVAERKNVLSLAFGLSALVVYLKYARVSVEEPKPAAESEEGIRVALPNDPSRLYLLFLGLFVLALLSKTTVAVLPIVILVIIWWKRGRLVKTDVLPLILPILIAVAAGLLTSYVEQNPYLVGASGPDWDRPWSERILLAGQTPWFYLQKLALPNPFILGKPASMMLKEGNLPALMLTGPDWLLKVLPQPLSFNYYKWKLDVHQPLQWAGLIGLIVVTIVLALTRKKIGRGPLACWAIFLVALLPASGLFNFYPMQFSWVADHFVYIAAIAIFVLFAATMEKLWQRIGESRRDVSAGIAGAALLGALTWTSLQYSVSFYSNKSLWESTLYRNDKSWMAAGNFGSYWLNQAEIISQDAVREGSKSESALSFKQMIDYADAWCKYALRLNPEAYQVYYSRSRLETFRGNVDEGMKLARKSDEIATAKDNKTWIYPRMAIAEAHLYLGEPDKARKIYEELQPLEPLFSDRLPRRFAQARMALADIDLKKLSVPPEQVSSQEDRNHLADAIENLNAAMDISQDWPPPRLAMARLLIETRSVDMGLQVLNEVLIKDKNNPDAKYIAALGAIALNQPQPAGTQLANLIETTPEYWPAYTKLAEVLVILNRKDDAIAQLELCLKRNPYFFPARKAWMELKGYPTSAPSTTAPSIGPATVPAAAAIRP